VLKNFPDWQSKVRIEGTFRLVRIGVGQERTFCDGLYLGTMPNRLFDQTNSNKGSTTIVFVRLTEQSLVPTWLWLKNTFSGTKFFSGEKTATRVVS
jgi:hypothetical protein